VPLLPDEVRFFQPAAELVIDISEPNKAEVVHVIASGDGLDSPEARVLQPPGENNVPVEPSPARRHLGEGHADLKGDACLLGQDAHRSDLTRGAEYRFEQLPNRRWLAAEVVAEFVPAARMRLIAIRESTTALAATPQWSLGTQMHERASSSSGSFQAGQAGLHAPQAEREHQN
jgi:hypothetical protein